MRCPNLADFFRYLKVRKFFLAQGKEIVESFVIYSIIRPACNQRVKVEDTCIVIKLMLHVYSKIKFVRYNVHCTRMFQPEPKI